jgi:hypothetical protein
MTNDLTLPRIENFLQRLGEACSQPTGLYLLGGTALYLLGNSRSTKDIDYVGDDIPSPNDTFALLIQKIAKELQIDVEAVPIEGFLPIPDGSTERHIRLDNYGLLNVYVYDPYTIALSKLDRGFDTDLDDVKFLITQGLVNLSILESQVPALEAQAAPYLIDVQVFRRNFQALKMILKA